MSTATTHIKTDKQLVPALRFKEFDGEWKKSALKKETIVNPRTNELPEKFIYIDLESVTKGILVKEEEIFLSEAPSRAQRLLDKDDILYQTVRPYQKNNLYFDRIGDYVASTGYAQIKAKGDSKYLFQFLHTTPFVNVVNRWSTGTSYPAISPSELVKIPVAFPSLPEQQKIASFLSAVDEKIQQLTKKKALLEQYKKGVMQQLFSGHLRFKDESGNPYPDWEEKKMGDIMAVRNDQAPKSSEYPLMAFIKHIGVAPKGDRYNREFLVNDGEGKKYKKTEYGDFIYSSNNLDTGSIGLNRYGSACISPVYSIFQIKELCDYQFISRFLVRKSFINKMLRFRQGVVYGQWKIHESAVLKIKEKIPCLEEQQKIATYLSSIDTKIEAVNNQITQTQTFKKGLLQQMFV